MDLLCEPDENGVCRKCGKRLETNRRVCSAKQPKQENPVDVQSPEPPEPKRSACCDLCVMSEKDHGDAVWCQPMYTQLVMTTGGCCGGDTPTRYDVANAIHAVQFGRMPCPVMGDQ